MNWLDVAILGVVALATFAGFVIGLLRAVLSLAGLVAAVVLAGRFYVPLSERLTFVHQAGLARGLAFAIIFVIVLVATGLLVWLLTRAVSAVSWGGSIASVGRYWVWWSAFCCAAPCLPFGPSFSAPKGLSPHRR